MATLEEHRSDLGHAATDVYSGHHAAQGVTCREGGLFVVCRGAQRYDPAHSDALEHVLLRVAQTSS